MAYKLEGRRRRKMFLKMVLVEEEADLRAPRTRTRDKEEPKLK